MGLTVDEPVVGSQRQRLMNSAQSAKPMQQSLFQRSFGRLAAAIIR